MVNQADRRSHGDSEEGKQRIEALANFQIVALKHAMSFPQVERIVYSTCSINEEENEVVISKVLQEQNSSLTNVSTFWKICRPSCLNTWKRRGRTGDNMALSKEDAECESNIGRPIL